MPWSCPGTVSSFSSGIRALKINSRRTKKPPLFEARENKCQNALLLRPVLRDKVLTVGWVTIMTLRYKGLRDHPAFLTCRNEDKERGGCISAQIPPEQHLLCTYSYTITTATKKIYHRKDGFHEIFSCNTIKFGFRQESYLFWIRNPKIGHEALRASYSAQILKHNYYSLKGGLQETSVLEPCTHL